MTGPHTKGNEGGESSIHASAIEPSLLALLARIAVHDQTAMSDFYMLTVPRVFSVTRAFLFKKEDAEEVVCDVYLHVWRRHADYDAARSSVVGWLLTLARSRALDRLRKIRQNGFAEGYLRQHADEWRADPGVAPDRIWASLESNSEMHRCLEQLSPLRQRLIAMAFFSDLSHAAIAKVVRLPLGTVKSHLRRALLSLRKIVPDKL